jgi:hypothetical protein
MTSRLSFDTERIFDPEFFVYTLMKWGEHPYDEVRAWTMEQMRANIPDYAEVLSDAREGRVVKYFEVISGATWQTGGSAGAAGVSVRNPVTGETVTLTGPGVIELSSYTARFETGVAAWWRAFEHASHAELLTAIGDGIASVEGFLNRKAAEWNATHPEDRLEDTPKHRVSFRTKADDWVAKMAGHSLDKNKQFWSNLLEIKKYRDEVAIHQKQTVTGVALAELARLLNLFTTGIAVPLFNFHQLFHEATPSLIIRAAYTGEVTVNTAAA